jgi:probable rRNA maturation factor
MIKINVIVRSNKWIFFFKNPETYLKKKLYKINKKIKFFKLKKIEFSLLLTENNEIKNLNKKFRKKNKPTDVLSFPFQNKKNLNILFKKKDPLYLGDIVINLNKILLKNDKNTYKHEFDKLWIHGLLHLLGYRHKTNKEYLKMRHQEKKLINLIN